MADVTIYTTPTCGYCRAAKDFMNEHGVKYEEIDVGSNQEKAREMIEKSGQMGVPVIVVKNGNQEDLIVGFDQQRMAASLGIS
jgi:glutaredoxin-like YruB-family protein